ncbi:MFS transporter [Bartonella massiliensis]|uniref:MFS transporter n=1 Tax=Bartonella massiliensis TaxID=929795 RepID=UPI0011590694|nr:MFS transporter [Bartonella massiliensis]
MLKILFISLAMFALGLDAYVVAGLLPQIAVSFDLSEAAAGQAVTIFTLCYALSAPFFTLLFAIKEARKTLLYALLVFLVANGVSACATNYTILLFSRAIAGLGAGLFSPIAMVAATQLVAVEKKGRALGLTLGGMSCGTVLGVPLGLLISDYFSWHASFGLVVLVSMIAFAGLWWGVPRLVIAAPASVKERIAVLSDKRIFITVLITFLTAIASLGAYTYLSPIITSSVSNVDMVIAFWVWGVGGVFGSFSIGYLIDKTKGTPLLLLALLSLMAIAIFSLYFMQYLHSILFLPLFIWGMTGWASLAPQQHSLLAYQPQHSNAALALNSSCNYLGSAVGALLGGLIGSFLSYSYIPLFATFILIVALLLKIMLIRRLET